MGCGRLGQPDCGNNVACTAPFTTENNNVCQACGGIGERCCDGVSGAYCGAGGTCNGNNRCEACGGTGQPCCLGRFCSAGACGGNGRCP